MRPVAQRDGQARPQLAPATLLSALGQSGLGAAYDQLAEREVDPATAQII